MAKALVLRTCKADGTSRHGFLWPRSGPVVCPDWDPKPECGNGLHGLLWGEGDGTLLNWSEDALWQVVAIEEFVCLGSKVKFRGGEVVHTGSRETATAFLLSNGGAGKAVAGAISTAGDGGTATAGDRGTATAGDGGTATAGCDGTATVGYDGTATAGDRGTLAIRWWDAGSGRDRIAIAYVGENGILPKTKYRLDESHHFAMASSTVETT